MEFIPQFITVFLLVLLNGFFVASEFALVGVRKTRIQELARKGHKGAKLVKKSLSKIDDFISATQLGITIASLALGWIGEPAVASFIEPFFDFLPQQLAFASSHTLAVIIAFSIITFLHIVLGELAPKTIALQSSEKTALFIIVPLRIFTAIFKPFIWFLNGAGRLVVKLIGITPPLKHQLFHSEEEIGLILSQSAESGLIEKEEAEMVKRAFELDDKPIENFMIPTYEVIAFEKMTRLNEVLLTLREKIHSRFPVFDKSPDKIVGFVHIRDIYKLAMVNDTDKTLAKSGIIRRILKLSKKILADDALNQMRKEKVHMAVVKDEKNRTIGIITLEDIIESIVGEIED
ncbi:HlyC/CorC family transporter [Candidatus Daviesbacteria bacterium]|nr:HlyC/CorC family transporter [Candidatus Daviesbacteria bacterium]